MSHRLLQRPLLNPGTRPEAIDYDSLGDAIIAFESLSKATLGANNVFTPPHNLTGTEIAQDEVDPNRELERAGYQN